MAPEIKAAEVRPQNAIAERPRQILARRLLLAASVVVVVALGLVLPIPLDGRLWGNLFDLAHAPVFCAMLLGVVGAFDPQAIGLPSRLSTVVAMTRPRVLRIAAVLMVVGGVGEFLQKFAGRSPDLGDVAANGAGIFAGLFWIASRTKSGWHRCWLVMAFVLILLAVSVDPTLEAWDTVQQDQSFPLLASFERPREIGAWLPHNATIERKESWSADGKCSAKITLAAGEYPGIVMDWFPSDWRSYRALKMEFHNAGDSELQLIVKLFDALHEQTGFAPDDRFHQSVVLPPESDVSVEILLTDVKNSPATRQMQLGKMSTIEIFSPTPQPARSFFVDHLRLEN